MFTGEIVDIIGLALIFAYGLIAMVQAWRLALGKNTGYLGSDRGNFNLFPVLSGFALLYPVVAFCVVKFAIIGPAGNPEQQMADLRWISIVRSIEFAMIIFGVQEVIRTRYKKEKVEWWFYPSLLMLLVYQFVPTIPWVGYWAPRLIPYLGLITLTKFAFDNRDAELKSFVVFAFTMLVSDILKFGALAEQNVKDVLDKYQEIADMLLILPSRILLFWAAIKAPANSFYRGLKKAGLAVLAHTNQFVTVALDAEDDPVISQHDVDIDMSRYETPREATALMAESMSEASRDNPYGKYKTAVDLARKLDVPAEVVCAVILKNFGEDNGIIPEEMNHD